MNAKSSNKDLKVDDNNLLIDNIDFKQLSKNCKTQDDLSKLTKQFMKKKIWIPYNICCKIKTRGSLKRVNVWRSNQ